MPSQPTADVSLFVRDGATTVDAAVESVLSKSWPKVALTLISGGSSTDSTSEPLQTHTAGYLVVRVNRENCDGELSASFNVLADAATRISSCQNSEMAQSLFKFSIRPGIFCRRFNGQPARAQQ
jgi:hypothetical protein